MLKTKKRDSLSFWLKAENITNCAPHYVPILPFVVMLNAGHLKPRAATRSTKDIPIDVVEVVDAFMDHWK